jgi:uncharacterized protein YcaQ
LTGSQLLALRRFAIARTFFPPTTLAHAIARLGFVQADPIRAPARAQDLTLRHRVSNYRAGDLERRYQQLDLDEGFFVNYGFLRRHDYLRMHPRPARRDWDATTRRRARALVAFVRENGSTHPRHVSQRFAHGRTVNYWGGLSNATTYLLGELHYQGVLRVVRRDAGIRVYALQEPVGTPTAGERDTRLDALIDLMVQTYAPVPLPTLRWLVGRLRYATPQWSRHLTRALQRARTRLAGATLDGVDWYWPADARMPPPAEPPERVRLLSPFDPLVWDRRRFERFWGWAYRLEAYTPAARRRFGYYALPLLWRDQVVGWANISWDTRLDCRTGFIERRPRERAFTRELDAELARLEAFLGVDA